MKDIKLSFPYPSTSRHNLSQDVSTSLSMGVLVPVRTVEVLPGDTHRIATSFSLISNPLVKPLLQGVRMRYCRFWVPRRIYHSSLRSNNMDFDPRTQPVRFGELYGWLLPVTSETAGAGTVNYSYVSQVQASSLLDYFRIGAYQNNVFFNFNGPKTFGEENVALPSMYFNVEPYLGYVDIVRNYFSDSATGMAAFVCTTTDPFVAGQDERHVCVTPLRGLDLYIDRYQNTDAITKVTPFNFASSTGTGSVSLPFDPFLLDLPYFVRSLPPSQGSPSIRPVSGFGDFRVSHLGLCVPVNRPDRLSRLFGTEPLTSQNATISSSEITISNLSFLSKLQRYLTRKFFGGSRFTDLMYSVFGQKVPHVDSPVLLDVFDHELGSELVASTNATETQNPGVTGGFMAARGYLKTGRGSARKKYTFNEAGYIMDLVYIMPRISRTSYLPDFYPTDSTGHMLQGNFIPDMNGIGWQQPAFVSQFYRASLLPSSSAVSEVADVTFTTFGFCCEPSWQQYRTLPDVCSGLLNPTNGVPGSSGSSPQPVLPRTINSPFYIFTDRMGSYTFFYDPFVTDDKERPYYALALQQFTPYMFLNDVFGVSANNDFDNIFVTFNYAHHAKRQVSKRFTLSFN